MSPKIGQLKTPEMNVNDMEINDQADVFPTWETMQFENNNMIKREGVWHDFPTFKDNSIMMHHTNFDPCTKKLYIGMARVKGKKMLENNIVLDVKSLGTDGAPRMHMAARDMLSMSYFVNEKQWENINLKKRIKNMEATLNLEPLFT
jgi:hypothetical protein